MAPGCCKVRTRGLRSGTFAGPAAEAAPARETSFRRALRAAGWVVPGSVLALLPKCPLCLAAYVALWTGVGLSVSTATYLRASLLVLCAASLVCLAGMWLYRHLPAFRK